MLSGDNESEEIQKKRRFAHQLAPVKVLLAWRLEHLAHPQTASRIYSVAILNTYNSHSKHNIDIYKKYVLEE